MPRLIVSQDPKVIPSVPEKNIDSVVMTRFKSQTDETGDTRVNVVLTPQDSSTGDLFPEESFDINLRDFNQQMQQSPKLVRAWDDLNDVMGLAYDFFRLREKVTEALSAGEDATALIAARNAALTALRAPVV